MDRGSAITRLWPALICAGLSGCSDDGFRPSDLLGRAGTAPTTAGSSAPPIAGEAAAATGMDSAGTSGGRPSAPAAGDAAAGGGGRGGTSPSAGTSGAAGNAGTTAAGSGGAGSAAGSGGAAAGSGGSVGAGGSGPIMIPSPVADDCITDVGPGDHAFTCQGQRFLVMVDEQCTKTACGLIFDVHGASMSGEVMRANTQLHELAPKEGFLTVHPSDPDGTWDLVRDPPILADFMTRMIKAFHVDERRVHFTGFSMGSAMTFWFLCNHPEVLASAAPVTGASADQVRVAGTDMPCIPSIDADWKPRVPILFMSGTTDNALSIMSARARAEGIVMRLDLTGGDQIEGDDSYTRRRWTGSDGMIFDFLEHDYSNSLLAGHCIPGGPSSDFIACTSGGDSLHWGKTVLEWMQAHPRP